MARRIMVIKIPLASLGMELVTVQLVAQYLNQMLHYMPPPPHHHNDRSEQNTTSSYSKKLCFWILVLIKSWERKET